MKENLQRLKTRFVLRACALAALLLAGHEAVVRVWVRGSSGTVLSIFLAALLAVIVTRLLSATWSAGAREFLTELREPLRIAGHKEGANQDLECRFEELSTYLGATARRSQRAEEQRARLMEDLFHALSQPLTTLRCQLELGLRSSRRADEYREYLGSALKSAERASALTVQLRDVSEAMTDVRNELSAFDETLGEVIEEISGFAEVKGIGLSEEPSPPATVAAHRERLKQALFRTLRFAIESAASESEVKMNTGVGAADLVFTVVSRVASGSSGNEELNAPAMFDLRLAEYIIEALGGTLDREVVPDQQILRVKLPAVGDGNRSAAQISVETPAPV